MQHPNTWQLQEAKNRFSALVNQAKRQGPQTITRHGKESVVLISMEDYKNLISPQRNLVELMRHSPLYGVELDLTRSRDTGRDVSL